MDASVRINRLAAAGLWPAVLSSACYARAARNEDLTPLMVLPQERSTPVEAGRVRGEELRLAGVVSLRDALNQVRPEFLRGNVIPGTHGDLAPPSIYMNGRYAGTLDALQLVQVVEVSEVRYFRPTTARTMYGAGCACGGGIIDVTTRRAP